MGGKKKTTNPQPRTKGNVKPSSSEKAANFLVQQTGSLGVFTTNVFDSSMFSYQQTDTTQTSQSVQSTLPSFVPVVQDPEASNLDPRFVSILKRLDKRDHVTKQKALRELLDITKTDSNETGVLNLDALNAILPFWPRVYYRLSFDGDRKVRELTQSVMHAVAIRIGRNLATYLKQVFPIWTFATVDSHEPAATLAYNGLHDIFPGSKLSHANRLYASSLLDMVDSRLAEIHSFQKLSSTKAKPSQHSGKVHSPTSNFFVPETGISGDDNHPNSPSSLDHGQRSLILKLAVTIRFLASFVGDLSTLSPNDENLVRLRNLLSPSKLWTDVATHLKFACAPKSSSELVFHDEYISSLYGSVYKLCTILCRDHGWRQWLIDTEGGQELARYICQITIGSLGYSSKSDQDPSQTKEQSNIPILPPSCDQANLCFTYHWEAALSCLTSLTKSFVWSVIDWRSTLVPRLDYLLLHGGLGQAKQVYPNLLCLLHEFPLDYSSLSENDQDILRRLFIDSCLKGLVGTLQSTYSTKSQPTTRESFSGITSTFFDPSILVTMITGILESSRYLIDRILTAISNSEFCDSDLSQQSSLVHRIFTEIVRRLLSDSLNLYRPPANNQEEGEVKRLVCTHTAASRQAYLDAVFSQIAQLCNNLAESKLPIKENLYAVIRNDLLCWIQETTIKESHIHVTRLYLGIIDPLRFGRFIDILAKAGTRKFGRRLKVHQPNWTVVQKPACNPVQPDEKLPVVSADWCVELFQTLAEILRSQIMNDDRSTKSKCFHIIIFLSIYGYLPLIEIPIPNLLGQIFTSVLPELPQEVHSLCWSSAAIRGLAKTWINTNNPCNEIGIPSSSAVCLNFINHILPLLLDILPLFDQDSSRDINSSSESSLFQHISKLLCQWIHAWFDEALSNTNLSETSLALNKIHVLLELGLKTGVGQRELIVQLFSELQIYLAKQLSQHLCSIKAKSVIHLRIFATIYLYTLEAHLKLLKSHCPTIDSMNEFYLEFSQILFRLYTIDVFELSGTSNQPKKSKLPGLKTAYEEPNPEDDLTVDLLLTATELIERSEVLLLDRLTVELKQTADELAADYLCPLLIESCFTAIAQSPVVNPTFLIYLNRLQDLLRSYDKPSSSVKMINLWMKQLMNETFAMVQAFQTIGYTNLGSRHLLPCLDLVPMTLVPQLARLVKLHLTGLYLKLHLEFNDQPMNRYLILLGLLRVWVSSLTEPTDWYLDFGWPVQINVFDPSSDESDPIVDPNLEASKSILTGSTQNMINKLGQVWHRLTSDQTLDKLFQLPYQIISMDDDDNAKNSWSGYHCFWNALLFNRIRTIHPNMWPRELKLAASLTNDNRAGQSWLETHVLSSNESQDWSEQDRLTKLCELYAPSGIVGRCFPRQELMMHLKSVVYSVKEFTLTTSDDHDNVTRSRILELLSCMTSVRFAAPIYITTFLPLVFDDFQSWLVSMADASGELNFSLNQNLPAPIFRTALSFMTFLESLLMLWQPWQWCTDISDKSPLSNHVGLIQLSLRIRELRPVLTQSQWDFILCSVISWVNTTVTWLNQSLTSDASRAKALALVFRAFRLAAALGAMFTKKSICLNSMSGLIILKPSSKVEIESWESVDDIDIEDDESPDNDQSNQDQADEYEEPSQTKSPRTDHEDFDLETMDDLVDNDEDDPDDEDENLEKSANVGIFRIPTRGKLPSSIQTDWDNFFSNHLYSTLLPMVFQHCLPNHLNKQETSLDCDSHIQALCAAFATCSASQLVQILTDKPQLVMEFLVDIRLVSSSSFVPRQLIQSRKGSTFDLSPGLRSSLDLACKLIAKSPYQCGQLLGHILLNRMFSLKVPTSNAKSCISLGNYFVHQLPTSWLSTLYGLFSSDLENYLASEMALDIWGRGSMTLKYLISSSIESGFSLNLTNHQILLAYLLAWDSLLNLLISVGPQTRACLQNALLGSSAAYFDRFMLIIGLLLPPSISLEQLSDTINRLEPDERLLLPNSSTRMCITAALANCSSKRRSRRPLRLMIPTTPGDDKEWRDAFLPDDSLLRLPGHRCAADLTHFAVRLLRRFLAEAPALMRSWHSNLTSIPQSADLKPNESSQSNSSDLNVLISPLAAHRTGRLRQFAGIVEKLVSRHFSLGLARDHVVLVQYKSELRLLQEEKGTSKSFFSMLNATPEVGSVRIKGYPLSRELIASYHMTDEHSMNILIQLPENYPLSPVTVEKSRGIGVSNQQWQSWICQLSVFINNHNGSILDGIDLWQKNARKKFEGVEECAICYSVVHSTGFTLPKMKCHTCRKLFHHACMYRWFQTSKNPACPLCRHMFFRPTGRPT